MNNVAAILLAAGQSTRFGTNKLLHPLENGRQISVQSAQILFSACHSAYAVVNDKTSELAQLISNEGLKLIENPCSENGIGTSVARAVRVTAQADAWLIALADMPYIKSETIKSIMQYFDGCKCIIAPVYHGQRGHPVLFSRHFYNELADLYTDTGARNIIRNNQDCLKLIPVEDAGVLQDIDVKADI